jgi:hypothetical protein
MNTTYPQIGDVVSYARADKELKVHRGRGEVRAIFVNEDKRVYVQIADGANVWNTSLTMINPSEELVAAFAEMTAKVDEMTQAGNKRIEEMVKSCNAEIEIVKTTVLGLPVDVGAAVAAEQPKETEIE